MPETLIFDVMLNKHVFLNLRIQSDRCCTPLVSNLQ